MWDYVVAVWNEFLNFIGGRAGFLHWVLFLLALLACMRIGRGMRRRLFWPSVLVLVFFFNPLFFWIVGTRFLSGVYWRLLWMLPVSFVIAYALTQVSFCVKKRFLRVAGLVLFCVGIAVTGRPVFSRETYWEKENAYELPQAAIEISDFVMARLLDWKETIIVPHELICDIRQYSCAIGLLYGRNVGGFISDIEEDEIRVYEEMGKEEPDVKLITDIAAERNCRYIVFNLSFHRIPEDLTEYGYEWAAEIGGEYVIYCKNPQ